MIKFFRKIRQRLLTENKLSKYLLYAIGEIVLVVIGILIALMLNTQKEQNTNKTQIGGILQAISKNLENDLIAINEVLEGIEKEDSLANKILKKKLTASDYEGPFY
jgi:sensor domain CHASE-containing protein